MGSLKFIKFCGRIAIVHGVKGGPSELRWTTHLSQPSGMIVVGVASTDWAIREIE